MSERPRLLKLLNMYAKAWKGIYQDVGKDFADAAELLDFELTAAIAQEREECAKVAEYRGPFGNAAYKYATDIAAAIRQRGDHSTEGRGE